MALFNDYQEEVWHINRENIDLEKENNCNNKKVQCHPRYKLIVHIIKIEKKTHAILSLVTIVMKLQSGKAQRLQQQQAIAGAAGPSFSSFLLYLDFPYVHSTHLGGGTILL